ncbi:MAG: hypothetical protein HGA65_19160, partial [Oscillochloris sp.]|nr:hypothetical protein [Oscillochloris sp.]
MRECTYEDVCQLAPLDILTALHAEIVADMRNDLARAGRAAALAHEVARMHPDSAHWSMGSAVLFVPRYAESLAHYDQALAWYARAQEQTGRAEISPDVRVVEVVRVFCLNELGRYQEALAAATRAEAWLRDHPTPRVRLTLLINRSLLAGHMGDYPAMLTLADETIALAADLDSRAQYAMGWINRGYACIWLGRFDEAEAAIATGQQAAATAEEGLTFARAQINRAWLLRCTGRLFAALTLLKEAERGMAQAEGERATIALEQAGLYAQLRQLREAQAAAERAADLFDAQSMPLYSASAYLQAARLMIEQQRPSEAEPLLGKARQRAVGLGLVPLEAEIVTAAARAAALPPKPGAPQPRRKAARAALAAAL